ncbi:MAG: T9SS type A sorting domain-containing protein [Sphingobacteriales bacterium]|nr:T9SS type A sorting domain-containing protein [Sphingobacteriales bacterium]
MIRIRGRSYELLVNYLRVMRMFLCSCFLVLLATVSQAQSVLVERVLEDASPIGYGLKTNHSIPDAIGGLYLVGSEGDARGLIFRTDSTGTPVWAKHYTGGAYPNIFPDINFASVIQLPDKDLVLSGMLVDTAINTLCALIMRCDSTGAVRWARKLDAPGLYSRFNSITVCPDGGFLCTGGIEPVPTQAGRLLVCKTDSTGQLMWCKAYDGLNFVNVGRGAAVLSDGSYIVTGFSENLNPFEGAASLMHISPNGAVLKSQRIRSITSTYCAGSAIHVEGASCYVYVYQSDGVSLLRGDTSLTTWTIYPFQIGGFSAGLAPTYYPSFRMVKDGSNGFLFTTQHAFGGSVFRSDTSGTIQWSRDVVMQATDAHRLADGRLAFVGGGPLIGVLAPQQNTAGFQPEIGLVFTDSNALAGSCIVPGLPSPTPFVQFQFDSVTINTSPVGTLSAVVVQDANQSISNRIGCVSTTGGITDTENGLSVNINPNPANDRFEVRIGESSTCLLEVFQLDGKRVFTSEFGEGRLTIFTNTWDAGIYLVRCQSGNRNTTVRVVVMH